mgnify:CR=1 FL=1
MKILDWIEEIICVFCTVVMTALVFANVLSRYVFHSSLSFSEEITTYLFVLLSMMGTAIAAKRRAHLGLSIITDAVGPKVHKALMVIGFAGTIVPMIPGLPLIFAGAWLMVMNQYNLGMQTSAMQWPEWIYATFVPFGAFFVTIRFAQALIQELKAHPEDHKHLEEGKEASGT